MGNKVDFMVGRPRSDPSGSKTLTHLLQTKGQPRLNNLRRKTMTKLVI